ncbi:hypothetical protein CMZ84_09835 [Lysobacteraceae bacterium NML93-0399]|nr:hypothetical protein CMZ84_09835 [Xanthomonadaceae bacterium NML93-0399]
MDKVTTWLWCDGTAEDMAAFYTGLIPDSDIVETVRAPLDTPGGPRTGDVLMVEFTLGGRSFAALNGGPGVAPSIALSLQVVCEDQAEVDRYWNALSADAEAEQCGWLRDRFGVAWQIVPRSMLALLKSPDRARARRAMEAMMSMRKLDIAVLEEAARPG